MRSLLQEHFQPPSTPIIEQLETSHPNRNPSINEGVSIMILIREVVQQVLNTGYLSIEAENQLRRLLSSKYDTEDLNAFLSLQQAASEGRVKQESRELLRTAR
nr:hypothetical protein [Microseira wollei]